MTPIFKNDDQKILTAIASVTTVDDEALTDLHGDQISSTTLEKAAQEFLMHYRNVKGMHEKWDVGQVAGSLFLSKEIQTALGIDLKSEPWLVQLKINDPQIWEQVKTGELAMISIGGRSKRVRKQ